ncbi:MAG: Fic family protein [Deltaproteobacteria bacterium]|nr:Fic family protein [Deltaproteobacteria bacterium]
MAQRDLIADALEKAKQRARDGILRSAELTALERERLERGGWLTRILRGYYLIGTPGREGESGVWYGHDFRAFVRLYLAERFDRGYCLSAKDSIEVHTGEPVFPAQIVVNTKKQSAKVDLPFGSSILIIPGYLPEAIEQLDGLRVMSLAEALCRVPASYFEANPVKAAIALRSVRDPLSSIGRVLLSQGMTAVAGRIVAAYRALGQKRIAEGLKSAMMMAGPRVTEVNPFLSPIPDFGRPKEPSAQALRVRAMWAVMRPKVLEIFGSDPGMRKNAVRLVKSIKEVYRHDAYNSLSIEGFEVTAELIEKVRSGGWSPDKNGRDAKTKDALAAKGYAEAFDLVLDSVSRVVRDGRPGEVAEKDLQSWCAALFAPAVRAQLIAPADLVGYRNGPVYIRGANHIPPNALHVPGMMEELFALLKEDGSAAARAVLGHFVFVHIHPFFDGNGRTARFLMNLMFVSGGWPWTIVRSEPGRRNPYFAALDKAHETRSEIADFARFLKEEMKVDWTKVDRRALRVSRNKASETISS